MRNDTATKILFAAFLAGLAVVGLATLLPAGDGAPIAARGSAVAGVSDSGAPGGDRADGGDGAPSPDGSDREPGGDFSLAAIANGTAVARFQADFEKRLVFRDLAVLAFGRVRWDLFRQGYRGVLAGDGGWLFSDEEFSPDLGYLDAPLADTLAAARDALAARGKALVVVPVPAKAVIESARLGRYRPSPDMLTRHRRFLDLLGSLGIPAADLEPAFRSGAFIDGKDSAFLRTDTHWAPGGAAAAARAVAALVDDTGLRQGFGYGQYYTQWRDTRFHEGDLFSFLPAGGGWFRKSPEPDLIAPPQSLDYSSTAAASFDALFGNQEIPVALVGTSYSASELWGFEAFLKEALLADVLNLAAEGRGPFAPMDDAIAGGELEASGVKLVIWEIPERYLPFGQLR